MKYKTTRRELIANYGKKLSLAVGYCDAQCLLSGFSPMAYTCGVYGWNFDSYEIEGVLITTGYRNLIGKTPKYLKEFEEEAKKISSWDNKDSFDVKQEKIRFLCREWIKKEFQK